MSCGAMIVTFLLFAGIVPGRRNCLHVIDEIQARRSPRSVSGFRLSLTTRLPAGNFLQELNSFSPGTSAVPVAAGVAPVGAGVGVGRGIESAVRRPNLRAACPIGGTGGVGVTPILVVVPSAPTTTAAWAIPDPSAAATKAQRIGCGCL